MVELQASSATRNLMDEHRVIERMLRILNTACDKLEAGEEVSPDFFRKVVDFVRVFADSCHHGKEEDTLFPALEKHGMPSQAGPIGVMLMEHEQGRRYVRALAEAAEKYGGGDVTVKSAVIENGRGYAALLSNHIPKEDGILYPMADRLLSVSENAELLQKFERIEEEKIGSGKHEYYLRLISDLERQLGVKESVS